jgi:hypothetical protein
VIEANVGDRLVDARGRTIGRVDAVYADYLLVRTRGLLPTDLYVPRPEVNRIDERRLQVAKTSAQAHEAWHRPLRRAPHD